MAIIPTTQTTIARYAAGLYGVKLGSATMNAVKEDVQTNTANGVSGLNAVLNSYYAPFAGMTSAQVAAIVVANAGVVEGQYGLTAANVADALAVVTAELNTAAPVNNQGAAIAAVLSAWSNNFTGAGNPFGEAARAWNMKIAEANTYAASAGPDLAFGAINTEFMLTSGDDNISGSAGDDTFIANFNGESNTLQSGDTINGGAGTDTLKAIMTSASQSSTPTIKGVENIAITAQSDSALDGGQNNVSGKDAVMVDFGRVSGVKQIWSLDSRADLQVEDVRILDTEITKDITLVMRDTDPGAVDFAVYFDQNSLRNVSSSTSLINLRVLDTFAASQGLAPLKDSPYGSFTFTYTLNGGAATVATLASPAIQSAQTFAELVVALQAAADGVFGAGTVTVATGSTYTVPDSVSNTLVQGTEIVLSADGNITFDTTPAGSGWLATETVPAISGLYTSFNTNVASTTALVTSTIVLDNVGRGSNGGDLIVGGLSNGETSASQGVQRFDIKVEDNSKLSNILSTNNTLREVYIVNGTTDEITDAYTTTVKDAGNLSVGVSNNQPSELDSGNQNYEDSAFGFNDVRVIDGSAMTGKLAFTAAINEASLAKYLNLKDTANDPAADNVQFAYSGGSADDSMAVSIDAAVSSSVGRLSTREDFKFTFNGGAGNDAITVSTLGTPSANSILAQKVYNNITVNGGVGNDTIRTLANADIVINAGAGNDTVYTDNSAYVAGNAVGDRAAWLVSAANADLADLETTPANDTNIFLYKGKLTVTYSGGSNGGVTAGAAAAFDKGFEVVVDVPTGANFTANQYFLNQAIKTAINGNAVLSKVLEAIDGPGNTLRINSLVDGEHVDTDLLLSVSATAPVAGSADETAMLTAFQAFSKNSAALPAAANAAVTASVTDLNDNSGMSVNQALAINGSNSPLDVDNIIDLGEGSDVLVLSTGTTSVETIKFTTADIGTNTVISFTAGVGGDLLDFNALLTGKSSISGSTPSQQDIAITLNADAVVEANSVTLLATPVFTTTETFAGLTAAKFLAAIQSTNTGTASYGGIAAGTLDALNTYTTAAPVSLVGGVGEAIVMVENDLNDGEYAVFKLTFNGTATNTTSDFTAATLVGYVDFGDALTGFAAGNLVA